MIPLLPHPIYIALGANLGDPRESFKQAIVALEGNGVSVAALSGLWQSPAWPPRTNAPDYINACAQVDFSGNARELLALLHKTEASQGRERTVLNAPRTLDLDLLDFRGEVITASDIHIPHPRMMNRGFVLLPLSQIAPNWPHPVTGELVANAIVRLPLEDISAMEYLGRENFAQYHPNHGKNAPS